MFNQSLDQTEVTLYYVNLTHLTCISQNSFFFFLVCFQIVLAKRAILAWDSEEENQAVAISTSQTMHFSLLEVSQCPDLKLPPSPRFSLSFSNFLDQIWWRAFLQNTRTIKSQLIQVSVYPHRLKLLCSRIVLLFHTSNLPFLPNHLPGGP